MATMASILIINGPNLNLLGQREPGHYGVQSLDTINATLEQRAKPLGQQLCFFQSNAEHELVERIHSAKADGFAFIIINPAAFTHTSVALRDALAAVAIPFIEVHLSNIYSREAFRSHSYFSDLAVGVISGLGAIGYELALEAAARQLANP
jgi:3-dehydroquinate dehydratase II